MFDFPLPPFSPVAQASTSAARSVSVLPRVRHASAAGRPGSNASGRRLTRCPRAVRRDLTGLRGRGDRPAQQVLEPYISRVPFGARVGGGGGRLEGVVPPQPQRQQTTTPLRSSTSLPALLADLDSSSDDDNDGADSHEAFTPRRPFTDGSRPPPSAGSSGGSMLRTPIAGASSSSLLDSVLGAPGGSRSAHADEERRKWALVRRSGGGRSSSSNGLHGAHPQQQQQQQYATFGRSPPAAAVISRSQSFPTRLATLTTNPLAAPARTPARAYHHAHADAVLTDPYAPPALDLSRRSPGGILTPYRSATTTVTAASASTGVVVGASSSAAAAAGGAGAHGAGRDRPARGGHRREPSRAETECYWQSSPSDSTAAAADDDDDDDDDDGKARLTAQAGVSSAEPSDAGADDSSDDDDDDDGRSALAEGGVEMDEAVLRAFGPSSSSTDPVTLLLASPPAPPQPVGLLRSPVGPSFAPLHHHHHHHQRPSPIEPLLFHPYSATPTALPSVVGRPPIQPTASSSSAGSASSLGRLVSAAATVERRSAVAGGGGGGEDGRSTSSDKENHGRSLAFDGEPDVFGGGGGGGLKGSAMSLGLPSVVVAPPPSSSADSPANGADKSRSRKKKALGGTGTWSGTPWRAWLRPSEGSMLTPSLRPPLLLGSSQQRPARRPSSRSATYRRSTCPPARARRPSQPSRTRP
jgi:hypothetical protein